MRSGRRIRGRPSVRQAYPLKLVRELAARHGIPSDQVKELQEELQFATEIGLSWGEVRRERARLAPERNRQEQRRQRIVRRVAALVGDLVADPDTLKWLLVQLEWKASQGGIDLRLPSSKKIHAALQRALPTIEIIDEECQNTRSSEQRGVKGNLELNMFTYLIAKYYDSRVSPFKFDHHQGASLTPAFDFLRDAAKLFFDVSNKQLITGARNAVRELGAHRKKRGSD